MTGRKSFRFKILRYGLPLGTGRELKPEPLAM
jgi:hypothetical protein